MPALGRLVFHSLAMDCECQQEVLLVLYERERERCDSVALWETSSYKAAPSETSFTNGIYFFQEAEARDIASL